MADLPENTGGANATNRFDPGAPQQRMMGNQNGQLDMNPPDRDNRLQEKYNRMNTNMPAAPASVSQAENQHPNLNRQNQLAQSMPQLPRGANQRYNNGAPSKNNTGGGLEFRDDASRVSMSRMKSSYGEELKRQMEADKQKRRKSKEKDRDEDIDFLQESFNYQPFGRGGAGAPLRDQFGNMITSRKPQMRGDHERQHFKRFLNKSSRGSSRASHRSHQRRQSHAKIDRYENFEEEDEDGFENEPDLIAAGPISNTTAQTAAQMASNRFFKPDYIVDVQPKKKKASRIPTMPPPREPEPQPPQPQVTYQVVQPQVDWAAWRNELFALLQWERWQREEEEKRRKYQWMNDEEKYKVERESMERGFQRDLEDRRRQFVDIQQENLERMQDYWEHRHDEEMRRWEEMMANPRYVQYLDRDNSVKLSQAFVDQLGSTMRLELDKIKGNMDGRDLELLKQIASLKKDATVADRERFDSLAEVDRMRGELENQKALDGIRHKYVYNTLLWDKLMDHKTRYPECQPKYKDFDYSKKYAVEKSIVDAIPTVPDGEKFKLDSLDKERIKIDDINQRSSQFLAQTINDKARVELDKLDSNLFNTEGSKTYRDAHDAYSRMGGLKTGEHQVNYKEF
ncbi:unnamed protein product [Moneuplotes crassus]|uniref:Uncharacterized protein n=1 Tax=Euplotes crassus TaxID=5936 RepID=A0AAD1U3T4_EUPCR|nr:unnamed protein product [Moneuplotes crassus]